MDLHPFPRVALVTLSLCLPLAAQGEKPIPGTIDPGTVTPEQIRELEQTPAPEVEQDPNVAAKREIEQIRAERKFIESVAQNGLLDLVRSRFLASREPSPRSVDVGVTVAPQPAIAQPGQTPRAAPRLMNDAEREQHGDEVVFLVDGVPVTKAEFEAMVAHYRNAPDGREPDELDNAAMRALIGEKAALARFPEEAAAARAKMDEIRELLAGGDEFADVAKAHSMCPSSAQGGDLGAFGRGSMVPSFERAAFATEVGKVSDIVQTSFGYHLIKVTEKNPDADQIRASHILVSFSADQMAAQAVMTDAANGQVSLAFVDDDWLAKSPF